MNERDSPGAVGALEKSLRFVLFAADKAIRAEGASVGPMALPCLFTPRGSRVTRYPFARYGPLFSRAVCLYTRTDAQRAARRSRSSQHLTVRFRSAGAAGIRKRGRRNERRAPLKGRLAKQTRRPRSFSSGIAAPTLLPDGAFNESIDRERRLTREKSTRRNCITQFDRTLVVRTARDVTTADRFV